MSLEMGESERSPLASADVEIARERATGRGIEAGKRKGPYEVDLPTVSIGNLGEIYRSLFTPSGKGVA